MKKALFKPARKLHKWLGYLLVLQILAWLLGGLIMSAIPLDKVHGDHLAKRQLANPFSRADYLTSLSDITNQFEEIDTIHFTHLLETPVLLVETPHGVSAFDGQSGEHLTPTESMIKQNARAHYLGNGAISAVSRLEKGPREAGHKTNLWRIDFDDAVNTTLYLDAATGQVITVRSLLWRIFDFFWMLHIMDYDERENFNNPLLISFAATSVLFCISGLILLLQNPPRLRQAINKRRIRQG